MGTSDTPQSVHDVKAFARQSSGLVRDLTLRDAAWYGIFASGGLYAFIFLFPYPQFASPGISVPLMLLLTLAFGVLVYAVYAALGSAMPRAGGDYLFQSRALHPFVGFVIPWACQLLFWLTFPIGGAYVVSTFGLVPISDALGWTGLTEWLLTANGFFAIAAIVVVGCCVLNIAGMRVYRILQRYVLVPITVVAVGVILVLLLININTDFAAKFDAFHASSGITVGSVDAAAKAAGWAPSGFSLSSTALWVVVLAAYIPYTMYSAQGLLGEVKQASSLRRLFTAFFIPGAFVAIVMLAIPFAIFGSIVGSNFMSAYASAYYSGGIEPAYSPNFSVFLSMLSSNTIVTVVVSLGFIAGGFGIANVVFLNASRVMLAMGLDGLLPRHFSDVDSRTHTPVKALVIWSALALAVAAVFSYRPEWQTPVILAGAITSVLVVGVTCLAGAVFPYRARAIYEAAPVARYRVGGVPAITIVGGIGAILVAIMIYVALTNDALALTSRDSRIVLVLGIASGVVVYVVGRLIRKSRGIDTGLAFREVPPE